MAADLTGKSVEELRDLLIEVTALLNAHTTIEQAPAQAAAIQAEAADRLAGVTQSWHLARQRLGMAPQAPPWETEEDI